MGQLDSEEDKRLSLKEFFIHQKDKQNRKLVPNVISSAMELQTVTWEHPSGNLPDLTITEMVPSPCGGKCSLSFKLQRVLILNSVAQRFIWSAF